MKWAKHLPTFIKYIRRNKDPHKNLRLGVLAELCILDPCRSPEYIYVCDTLQNKVERNKTQLFFK